MNTLLDIINGYHSQGYTSHFYRTNDSNDWHHKGNPLKHVEIDHFTEHHDENDQPVTVHAITGDGIQGTGIQTYR